MKLILALFFLVPNLLMAKTIFEPNLGVTRGSFSKRVSGSTQLTNGAEFEASYSSLTAGFRYGITRRYIHVTLLADALVTNVSDIKVSSGALGEVKGETDVKFNTGIGLGYEWNIPLRTYILLGSRSTGIELSYFWSEKLLIGLKVNRLQVDVADFSDNVNTYGLAVSFPMEFEYPSNWFRKRDWE